MSHELLVTGVVLGSALMHATWNALVKTGDDRLVTLALISTVWLVLGGALAAWLPLPAAASWPFLLTSVALHYVYLFALLLMYREGDLSQVYPIARGSAPLLLALLSALLVGERLPALEWAGVALVSAGILSLTVQGRLPRGREWRPIGAALFTGVLIVCYTLNDGLGVRRTDAALGYAVWLFFLQGLPWCALLVWLRVRRPERVPLRLLGPGLLAGALSMAAYGLVLWALSVAPMGPIAALRETGVIFAAAIGALKLGEPFGRRRILASALVALGVACLNWPG
jgi:drug/metabolite transporter (DMT)-like permease